MACDLHAPLSSTPDAVATEVGSLLGLPGVVGTGPVFPLLRLPLAISFRRTALRNLPSFGVTMSFPRTHDPSLPCYT